MNVRVRHHVRRVNRRAPRQSVKMKKPVPVYVPHEEEMWLGQTSRTGQSVIYLEAHTRGLDEAAKIFALKLKEAHYRDDVIETMVHESLHSAITVTGMRRKMEKDFIRRGYGWDWERKVEEAVVEKLAIEAMEDVRELPRIAYRRPH